MRITLNKEKTEVTIVLPYSPDGVTSKKRNAAKVHIPGDGKSFLHFSVTTKEVIDGKELKVGINGYSENPAYVAPTATEEGLTVDTAKLAFAKART